METEKGGNILDTLKDLREEAKKPAPPAIPKEDPGFNVERLMTEGTVDKVIENGKVKARFKTNSGEIIFDIDTKTDVVSLSHLSGNSRRAIRYMCSSLMGYGVGEKWFDMSKKGSWEEVEKDIVKLPEVLINRLLSMHVSFENEAARLLDEVKIKN